MGITFGDKADVHVEGDMVGGDKKVGGGGPDWDAVVALIVARGLSTEETTEAVQAISTIRHELSQGSVHKNVLEMAASAVKRIAPAAFELLLKVAPELVAIIPQMVMR